LPKEFPNEQKGFHPFGELIGLEFTELGDAFSRCRLVVDEKLYNPHRVLHGGAIYSMADTAMGAAVYSVLEEDELCTTVEIKIHYFSAVTSGTLECETWIIHRTKKLAVLESEIRNDGELVAKASGTFYIYRMKK
jgi:acyl-CoA thioesterase